MRKIILYAVVALISYGLVRGCMTHHTEQVPTPPGLHCVAGCTVVN